MMIFVQEMDAVSSLVLYVTFELVGERGRTLVSMLQLYELAS